MAWPLRHLGKALHLIAEGYFNPDESCTRSGAWQSQDDAVAVDLFLKDVQDIARKIVREDPARGEAGDA